MREKFSRLYHALAAVFFNSFLLFLFFNLGLGIGYYIYDRHKSAVMHASNGSDDGRPGQPNLTPKRNGYQLAWVDTRSYLEESQEKVHKILDDFYDFQNSGSIYEPEIGPADPIFESDTINIQWDEFGSRRRVSKDLPSHEKKVFVFGGSTMLGWNLTDDATIPVNLQKVFEQNGLRVSAVNYGRSGYSWYQELLLLQRLLHSNARPDAIVFLDGTNIRITHGSLQVSSWAQELITSWESQQFRGPASYPPWIPIFRLINKMNREEHHKTRLARLNRQYKEIKGDFDPEDVRNSYLSVVKQVKALTKQYGIASYFFWQPDRSYKCDFGQYSTKLSKEDETTMGSIYRAMEKPGPYFNLSHLCEKYGREPIFVDDVHYNSKFSRYMAKSIADSILPSLKVHLAAKTKVSEPAFLP